MIRAIVFDFDGTLADTLPLLFHAFREVFRAHAGRELTDGDVVGMFGPTEEGMIRNGLAPALHERAVADLHALYEREHDRFVALDPAILSLLRRLRSAGCRLAIFTGKGRRTAGISLRRLALADYFDAVVTGDDVERPKPDPEGLLRALAALGAAPAAAVFAGDSEADVRAAKAAGVRAIAVNWLKTPQTTEYTVAPDAMARNAHEFWRVLEQWGGAGR